METITLPRVIYDMLVEQMARNAKALSFALLYASQDKGSMPTWRVYGALTSVDDVSAKRELNEWMRTHA